MTGKAAILFRFDAAPHIGAGHAMRCLAAAEIFAEAGWRPVFVTNREAPETVPALAASGFAIEPAAVDGTIPARLLGPAVAAVVFDHYGLGADAEAAARGDGRPVVTFDDLAERSSAADILVNPTPGLDAGAYEGKMGQGCRLLLGPDHAMIRRTWLAYREASLARHAAGGPVRRILVSMGATDPGDMTGKVVAALARLDPRPPVDIVLGVAAPHREALRDALPEGMALHVDPPSPAGLAAQADLAVGAAGGSSFERAVLGLPALLVQTADNQRRIARAFATAGAAEIVPATLADDPAAFAGTLRDLAGDTARRQAMSAAAAGLTDGRGACRLLAALAATGAAAGMAKAVRR